MMNSKNRLTRSLVVFAGLVLFTSGHKAFAQESSLAQEIAPDGFAGISNAGANSPEDVKTLEQVRTMGGLDTGLRPMISGTEGTFNVNPSISPRDFAMARIRSLQQSLSLPNADHSELVPQLKSALADYFIADMRHRVHELDEIKAKVAATEANLQKRLDSQKDAVDLQLKIMLREADGFGFFHKEDARSQAGFGSHPGMSGPVRGFGKPSPSGLNGLPPIPRGAPAGLKPSPPKTKR